MLNDLVMKQVTRRALVQASAAAAVALPVATRFGGVAGAQDKVKVAFSVPGLNYPFFVHMANLAQQHADELGVELIVLDGQENGKPSSTKQTADLEAAAAQGVMGVVISPNDVAALAPAIEALIAAGIPVVTVDRALSADSGVATLGHVGADNVLGGVAQGEYVLEWLADGGTVWELQGAPGASAAIDRDAGFKQALEGQDAVTIEFDQTAEFARDKALTVVESALAANDVPDVIVCANDDMALGAIEAIEAAGEETAIIGFDALPEALQAIAEGRMAATVEQMPGKQAQMALDILLAFLADGTEPAEHTTLLTPIIIDMENLTEAERYAEAFPDAEMASPEASPEA